jgi:hypothetical protein
MAYAGSLAEAISQHNLREDYGEDCVKRLLRRPTHKSFTAPRNDGGGRPLSGYAMTEEEDPYPTKPYLCKSKRSTRQVKVASGVRLPR